MSNDPQAPFTQATGYATVEVALAWAEGSRVLSRDEYEILQGKDGFENCRADRKASIVLAAEVRRLLGMCERIAAQPDMAARMMLLAESHNKQS